MPSSARFMTWSESCQAGEVRIMTVPGPDLIILRPNGADESSVVVNEHAWVAVARHADRHLAALSQRAPG